MAFCSSTSLPPNHHPFWAHLMPDPRREVKNKRQRQFQPESLHLEWRLLPRYQAGEAVEPDQTGSSLYQTPAVATSGLCAPSHSTQRVGSLHSVPYFPVMFLKLKSSRQSLSPRLLAASKLQRVGLAPLGTALAHKEEKLFPSLHLWKSHFFQATSPPSSSSPLPTCLANLPSAVAKTGSSPKQPPLTLSFPAPLPLAMSSS